MSPLQGVEPATGLGSVLGPSSLKSRGHRLTCKEMVG